MDNSVLSKEANDTNVELMVLKSVLECIVFKNAMMGCM